MNKAYKEILKSVASKSHYNKNFLITGTSIEATDLLHYVSVNYETAGSGVVNSIGLERVDTDPKADLEPYKEGSKDDFPELDLAKENFAEISLSPHTLDLIIEAGNYISKDTARPVLTAVWIKDGCVMATDGYRAYCSEFLGLDLDLILNFDKEAIAFIKKIKKLTEKLTITYSDNFIRLTNGEITYTYQPSSDRFVDLITLLKGKTAFDYSIVFPAKELAKMITRDMPVVRINTNSGEIYLNEHHGTKSIPTGMTARISEVDIIKSETNSRRILMPMSNTTKDWVAFDYNLLKSLVKPNKDGELILLQKRGQETTFFEIVAL